MKIAVEERIVSIVKDLFKTENEVKPKESFIQTGMISSLQLVELLFKLENIYGVEFDLNEIEIAALESPAKLADLINNLNGLDEMNLRDMFLKTCEDGGDHTAFTFDEEVISYIDLRKNIQNIVANMMKFGIKKGTKVAIILSNRIEYIYSYFALLYIGAWSIPINIRWTQKELNNILKDSESEYIICSETAENIEYGSYVSEYIADNDLPGNVFYFGKNLYADKGIKFSELLSENSININDLEKIKVNDPAMLSYTSGTTGMPKGVIIKHNDIVKISLFAAEYLWKDDDTPMSIAPLYAAQGFLSLFINLSSGCSFKMLSTFNPNDILKQISKGENTILHTQPTMWTLLLNCRIINFINFGGLKTLIVSGSICSPELAKRIEEKIGCRLMNLYGLIEGTSVVTMTRLDDPKDVRYNTVGRAIPGIELKIVDEQRNELPKGEVGELAIRGYVMQGYYNNPKKTAETIDKDGWLYTGDLAKYYDAENISIVGRCKDMIIRGGFNVYPSDIEEYVLQMPEVQTVAITGCPHEVLGEETVAFVVPKVGKKLTDKDILKYLFKKVSNYKLPDKVYMISEMPIILAGKIDKKVLKDWAINGVPSEKQILFK